MAKSRGAHSAGTSPIREVERRAQAVADEQGLELVEVTLQKESRGRCLCAVSYTHLIGRVIRLII